ncbi:MAG: hypothetical protein OEV59_07430 [Deltaproteobacteria bacterium]|nr:hypothetical protein [Deltaproteobacteria bacterium]
MVNRHILLLVAALAFLLSGCLDAETVIDVKKDGSGEMSLTVLFVGMPITEEDLKKTVEEEKNKDHGAEDAATGVRFKSVEQVKTDKGVGMRTVYVFDDIRNVKLGKDRVFGGAPADSGQGGDKRPITFGFERSGDNAVLTVNLPQDKDKKKAAAKEEGKAAKDGAAAQTGETAKSDAETETAKAMMKTMFEKMRISVVVKVGGKIVKTNARHAKAAEGLVTIMDIDFGKIVNDEKQFEKFFNGAGKDMNPEEISKIEGVKFENQEVVKVEF